MPAPSPAPEEDAYVWQPSGQHLIVHIQKPALASIATQARGEGTPTGVLLGTQGLLGDSAVIVAESAQPASLSTWAAPYVPGSIGFYRMDAEAATDLATEDRDLLQAWSDTPSMFLLVRPFDGRDPEAWLFVRQQGRILRAGEPLALAESPLRRAEAVPDAPPADEPAHRLDRDWPRRLVLGAAALVLSVAALNVWTHRTPAARAARTPVVAAGFELTAQPRADTCILKWNPAAAAFRTASVAKVLIRDGSQESTQLLSKAQIQAGSLVFTPATGNVTISLETVDANGHLSRESVALEDVKARELSKPSPVPPDARQFPKPKPAPQRKVPPGVRSTTAVTPGFPACVL